MSALQPAVRAAPVTRVLVHNESRGERTVQLHARRDGRTSRDSRTLRAGEVAEFDLPAGRSPATVEVHAADGMAATSVGLGHDAPLFAVREAGVLLACD